MLSTSVVQMFLFLQFFLLSRFVASKRVVRKVRAVDSWLLVDRFAFRVEEDEHDGEKNRPNEFDAGEGEFKFSVTQKMQDRVSVSLYIDKDAEWIKSYTAKASEMSCSERHSAASVTFNLWKQRQCTGNEDYTCNELNHGWASGDHSLKDQLVTTKRSFQFRGETDVWMYVVISNCDPSCTDDEADTEGYASLGSRCQASVDVEYEFQFRNMHPFDNPNLTHFSADECGAYTSTIVFLVFQCFSVLMMAFVRNKLVHRRKFHWTVFMLAVVISLYWLSLVLAMVHYSDYSHTGVGFPKVLEASRMVEAIASTCFIALLILLAKGWTIVRRKISPEGRIKIVVFCTFYLSTELLAHILHNVDYDVGVVTYLYGSGPGVTLVVLRCFAALWFSYAASTTRKNFDRKKSFYFKFNNFYLGWLLSLPLLVLVANGMETTSRWILVRVGTYLMNWLGQVILLVLYNPSTQFNRSFPFHSTTAAMMGMNGRKKDNAKDTAMYSANRSNRLEVRRTDGNGEETQSLTTNSGGSSGNENCVQSSYNDKNTMDKVQTVSGGLGIRKSKKGQVVVTNQFDAAHFLRIKLVSDAVKDQLASLVERSMLLDSVLDAVTVDNPAQYGKLGYDYLNSITENMKREEALVSASRPGDAGRSGFASFVPKKAPVGFDNVDRLKMKDNGNQVLEMVKRVGTGAQSNTPSTLHRVLDDEVNVTKGLSAVVESPKARRNDARQDDDRDQRREDSDELDKNRHPPSLSPPSKEHRFDRGSRRNSRDNNPEASPNSEDEFDHDMPKLESKAPNKSTSKGGGPPSGPPPRRKSFNAIREGSRQGSRRGSRDSSEDVTPLASQQSSPIQTGRRAPLNSFVAKGGIDPPNMKQQLEEEFQRLEREGEIDGVVKKTKKKKKRTEEEKRERRERRERKKASKEGEGDAKELAPLKASSRTGSRANSEDEGGTL